MKKRIVTLMTALVMLLALVPAAVFATELSCPNENPYNLLVNPCAEMGLYGWNDPDGRWGTDDGSSNTREPKCGKFFFWPETSDNSQELYQLYQDVALPGTPGKITLTAWVAAWDQIPNDLSGIVLQVFDVSGKLVGESSASNESLDRKWNQLRLSGNMSAGIYGARVILQGQWQNGVITDAYFDHLELTLQNPDGSYYTPDGSQSDPDPTYSGGIGPHSDWAGSELESASYQGLIPVCLQGKDLTRTINRTEFAAVAIKLYEKVSGKTAQLPVNNPFFDTDDPEVLKAFGLGIINGTGEGIFSPSDPLTREQAAVILVRAYNAARGYSMENQNTTFFADHDDISLWARDSVYTMAAYGVINGVGENRFAPKGHTSREQAVIIATRSLDKIPSGPSPQPTTPQPDGGPLSADQIYQTLIGFQSQYPEGMPWDNSVSYETKAYAPDQRTGYGCSAFAYLLSDGVFGDQPVIAQYDSFGLIRPGDTLRVDHNTHHVIVLRVLSDRVIVAEANYNSSVHWGREISRAELEAGAFIGETRSPI